jgi:hypothetical protein
MELSNFTILISSKFIIFRSFRQIHWNTITFARQIPELN